MEELKIAMEQQMDLMADLVQKLSTELRSGFGPAYDNFIGFFHAIDWKVLLPPPPPPPCYCSLFLAGTFSDS